jgi:dienelactone hydrolase
MLLDGFYMTSKFSVKLWFTKQFHKIKPGQNAVSGATCSLLLCASVLFLFFAVWVTLNEKDPWILSFFVGLALICVLSAYLITWLLDKVHAIPKKLKIALLIASPLLFLSLALEIFYWLTAIIIISLLGAAINVFLKGDFVALSRPKKSVVILSVGLGLSGVIFGLMAYIPVGFESGNRINAAALNADDIKNIHADSPAQMGQYQVNTLTYGSGNDKHRAEFAEQVTIKTTSVNGVAFLDGWQGFSGWYREQYWGFDDAKLPRNAYVWYPQGEGPFPLVLMVHGNHSMQDFSDDGYAYLGKLLASRGFIFASVDQNFINSSWSDIGGSLDEENDARGWLLLEHLQLWRGWNADNMNQFYNKVDTQNIALIGHSRGGEAVAHAALLNQMKAYYDDATIAFDFNFNIQSILAIAPVDGQYMPGNNLTALEDINYFVMHGAQDADVSSFAGMKQYERIKFSDNSNYFKSSVYIEGANHGQFNSGWGDNDTGFARTHFLNNLPLLTAQDQQTIAQVYISAFLQTTLKNDNTYMPLFIDHRKGKDWLPDTIYLNQFDDASFVPLASFDEDFDVSTTSIENGQVTANNLSVWREQEVKLKWGNKGTRAAVIGWHSEDLDTEQIAAKTEQASFQIEFPHDQALTDINSMLVFALAESTENSKPKASGKWINENADNSGAKNDADESEANNTDSYNQDNSEATHDNNGTENKKEQQDDEDEPQQPIDFTIEIEDAMGQKSLFALSQFSALQREIKVNVWKAQVIIGSSASETVFQTFSYPLAAIKKANPQFDVNNIKRIQFKFDKSQQGVFMLDNIGFMRPTLTNTSKDGDQNPSVY